MRAVVFARRGPAAEALELHTDWPRPQRQAHQVLVEVAAASVNPGEWKLSTGFAPIPVKLPKILGEDMAGVVVEAPEGSKFKPGDKVFGGTGQALKSGDQGGTYGEFVAVDEDRLCPLPLGVSFQEAAAVPVAGITAWQALAPAMPLAGKRVLVHGGAGGVGGFAIQIAVAHGAHVTTTCSARNIDYVTGELGAEAAIDYTAGPWEKAPAATAQPFDVVVDTIGGPYQAASMRLLRRGGVLSGLGATGPGVEKVSLWGMAALLAGAAGSMLKGKMGLAPRFNFVFMDSTASKGLAQIAELMSQGKLKAHLDRVYPLEEMVAAHEQVRQGHVRGKVGILVKQM